MVEVSMMEIGLLGVGLIVGYIFGKMNARGMQKKGNIGDVSGNMTLKGNIDASTNKGAVGGNNAEGRAKQNN